MEAISAKEKKVKEAYQKAGKLVAEKYNNWGVILSDPEIIQIINKRLQGLRDSGVKYKRHPFDYLKEGGNLRGRYFVEQYGKILLKQSGLASSIRAFISLVVEHAARDLTRAKVREEVAKIIKPKKTQANEDQGDNS